MKDNRNYSAAVSEGFVDISSGFPGDSSGARYNQGSGNKNKKRVIIIVSIALAVAAALGVAGFCIFNGMSKEEKADENLPFTFTDKTVISGIDVTGKTLEQAKQTLEQNKNKLNKPIEISVNLDGTVKSLNQDNFTYTYNIDDVLRQAYKDALDPNKKIDKDEVRSYTVTSTVEDKSITDNVAAITKEIDVEPKDAYVSKFHPFEDSRFEYTDEINGRKLDGDDLAAKLKSSLTNGGNFCKIDADIEQLPAEVTADYLKNNLVELASYETYSTNTENGTTNMTVALNACNGSVINPGDDIWSFNSCTGDSNKAENGYKPAHVISEGKLIDGIGGGICQASSTIYNAALRADLEIEERYCHQWASAYVPTGLDATIDYPNLDLKLSNRYNTQVFLECRVVDNTLHAAFWGVKHGNYDEIKTHNEISDTGKSSYTVRAWRVYLMDGSEVQREELFKSTYDMDYGVVFIDADYDSGVVYRETTASSDDSEDTDDDDDEDSQSSEYDDDSGSENPDQSSQSSVPESSQEDPPTESSAEETQGE